MYNETDYIRDLNYLKFNNWNGYKKPVIKYDKNGKRLQKYETITEASKQNDIPVGNISRCCLLKAKSAGGFKWLYADI